MEARAASASLGLDGAGQDKGRPSGAEGAELVLGPQASSLLHPAEVEATVYKLKVELTHAQSPTYRIRDFPPEVAEVLQSLDADNDGFVDKADLDRALKIFRSGAEKQGGHWQLPLECFPSRMHSDLRGLKNVDSDGQVDTSEIELSVKTLLKERKHNTRMLRSILGISLFALLVLIAIGGMVFYVVDLAKDTEVGSSGSLVNKASGESVKVSSADFVVKDGSLMPNEECAVDGSCNMALATSEALFEEGLSSDLSDDYLQSMTEVNFMEDEDDKFLSLKITGSARQPDVSSQDGTVVWLMTQYGNLRLDGEEVEVDESLVPYFEMAGFTLESPTDDSLSVRSHDTLRRRGRGFRSRSAPRGRGRHRGSRRGKPRGSKTTPENWTPKPDHTHPYKDKTTPVVPMTTPSP